MTWDDEDTEFARNQLIALGKAVYSHAIVYADFPSAIQATALSELVGELKRALGFFEENRKAVEAEGLQ